MSRVLKASNINIDNDNRVSVKIENDLNFKKAEIPEEESKKVQQSAEESKKEKASEIVSEAIKEASQIIRNAKDEAEKEAIVIKSEAEKVVKQMKDSAKSEGYQEGYNKGVLEAEEIKKQAQEEYENIQNEVNQIKESLEPELLDLVISILDKLIKGTKKFNPQLIISLIRQGLSDATTTGSIFIHVSEADYETVVKNKNEILSMVETGSNVEIIKDSSLSVSDCIIETPLGNIDCSLEGQFSVLKENLYYILNN